MTAPLTRPVYQDEHRPWGLILALTVALIVGAIGLPLQFVTYRQLSEVSRTKQLQEGQQALCSQINAIAAQAGLTPTDCAQINTDR
jgi:hypothetical protein